MDQRVVEIGAVKRGQDRDGEDSEVRPGGSFARGADHVGVAMHRQEIEIELGDAAHRFFDRRRDVEELHVQKDTLAMFGLEFIRQRQPAAGQHPEADLVETGRIADLFGNLQALERVGGVEGDDQTVIGHAGSFRDFGLFRRMGGVRQDVFWCKSRAPKP